MEELTSTVAQNAASAERANMLALSASEVATRGGQAVAQAGATMSEIVASVRRVTDIMGESTAC